MSPLTNGQNHRLMVGMDIGSANITCAVGQANSSTNRIKLRGISSMPSKGIKRGIITNRNELIDTLEKVINDRVKANTVVEKLNQLAEIEKDTEDNRGWKNEYLTTSLTY